VEQVKPNVLVNKLEVKGLSRDRLNSTFKCQASNTKLMMPLEKTVRLELLCKLSLIDITNCVSSNF